ncbi:MAG: hypothetical protein H6581_26235 [Bacteroidia bacterium]|nr:hypothetical protein [Bacteroidia bacterium]
MDLEIRKYHLIQQITRLEKEALLAKLEEILAGAQNRDEVLKTVTRPMRKETRVEDLMREQSWTGFDMEKFDQLVKDLDIQEPLEDLLKDI